MKKIVIICLIFAILVPLSANAMSKEERVADANTVINLFTQQYGPLKWKEEYLGINFDELASKLISDAAAAATDKDFYRAISAFLNAFGDAHVSYEIPSSLEACLPFNTEYFKDGVVITGVNYNVLCQMGGKGHCDDEIPVEEGDLLIAIDGIPVEDVIASLVVFENNGHEETSRKFTGSVRLACRPQYIFPDIPSGASVITIITKDGTKKDVALEWISKGFELAEMPPKSAVSYMAKAMTVSQAATNETSFIENVFGSYVVEMKKQEADAASIGSAYPFFPLWDGFETRKTNPYLTGTFAIGDHNIGFIRINTWSGSVFGPGIKALEEEIEFLNNNTDAIIIDQTNNGGGNICYTEQIASFFIFSPQDELRFQPRANRTWLSNLEYEYEYGKEEFKPHAKVWLDGLRKAVTSGEYLSKPLPICNLTGKLFPHKNKNQIPVLYTKPVLILVNELDFSAADMFPAMMQDFGAATLFGVRTAGAGGNVVGTRFIGNSELAIRITQSLAYRINEVPLENGETTHYVENVGATPDIEYEVTLKDYKDGYKNYREAINSAVMSLIGK